MIRRVNRDRKKLKEATIWCTPYGTHYCNDAPSNNYREGWGQQTSFPDPDDRDELIDSINEARDIMGDKDFLDFIISDLSDDVIDLIAKSATGFLNRISID